MCDYLIDQEDLILSEKEAAPIIFQVLSTVRDAHAEGLEPLDSVQSCSVRIKGLNTYGSIVSSVFSSQYH